MCVGLNNLLPCVVYNILCCKTWFNPASFLDYLSFYVSCLFGVDYYFQLLFWLRNGFLQVVASEQRVAFRPPACPEDARCSDQFQLGAECAVEL